MSEEKCLLQVENLNVYYGSIHAIKGISFHVNEGEIVTLIGANGAGKSTTLNTIAGLLKPKSGTVTFDGKMISGFPANRIVPLGMALCPEGRRIFQQMTVRRQIAGTLSGGEQQMLAMSRALMSKPKVLMLDEPSMGLAPILVDQIFQIIQELHASGTTILLVEQNARKALQIANRAYVLETGAITLSGTGAELANSPDVKKAYLGG